MKTLRSTQMTKAQFPIPRLFALISLISLIGHWSLNLSAQSALTSVQYNASDFTGATNNLPVTFTPTNGSYTTNVFPGLYDLTIQGIDVGVTCLVPASTNVQNLAACVINNLGLFSASNLNPLITHQLIVLAGTNVTINSNGFVYTVNSVITNLDGLAISNGSFINPILASSNLTTQYGGLPVIGSSYNSEAMSIEFPSGSNGYATIDYGW